MHRRRERAAAADEIDIFQRAGGNGLPYRTDGTEVDPDGTFQERLNAEMVALEEPDDDERAWLRTTVERHRDLTGSAVAERLLAAWDAEVGRFHKVMPHDYKRVLTVMKEAEVQGLDEKQTLAKVMEASRG